MEQNYEKTIIIEPIFDDEDIEEKTAEIEALLKATSATHFMTIIQKIREINPATIVGVGKLKEIKELVHANDVELVVFDGELSPSQLNNVVKALDIKVINRTTLILDIFARNARSLEGKILVELAQLQYNYSKLCNSNVALSRLGGGIGTRGPGETQLETDRRHIKTRILYLEKNLAEIEKRRKMQSYRRKNNGVKTIALVGYTNTGKSTLLNLLSDSDVLAENKLFATLDPTARKTILDGYETVIIDTVGFVKRLPPDLMRAFKSTLECAVDADLILNVCDVSDNWKMQIESTEKSLNELGVTAPVIVVANKCDKVEELSDLPNNVVRISAAKGLGIDELKKKICEILFADMRKKTFTFEYGTQIDVMALKKYCYYCETEYNNENIILNVTVSEQSEHNLESAMKEQNLI